MILPFGVGEIAEEVLDLRPELCVVEIREESVDEIEKLLLTVLDPIDPDLEKALEERDQGAAGRDTPYRAYIARISGGTSPVRGSGPGNRIRGLTGMFASPQCVPRLLPRETLNPVLRDG